jgi:hypothetical protein
MVCSSAFADMWIQFILLVYTYDVVKILGGPLVCCVVLSSFHFYLTGSSIYVYYVRSGRKADFNPQYIFPRFILSSKVYRF